MNTPQHTNTPPAGNASNTAPDISTDRYAGMTHKYYWFFILYMVGLSMFGSFVNDMYIPALPAMAEGFRCSASTVQLGLSFGMIGLGLGQIVFGPISDKYGRKCVLTIGLFIFMAGGIASALSPTIYFFIGCRLVQGIGASTGYFLARTMPADVSHGKALARIMALIGAINGIAPASAPVVGGFISSAWGWRGIFIILSAFALVLYLISLRLKETLPDANRATGTIAQTFEGYYTLLKRKRFVTHVMFKGATLGLLFAYVSSAPFIVQTHYGYTQVEFGLIMGFNALFVMSGSMLALRFRLLKKAGVVGAMALVPMVVITAICLWLDWSFVIYEIAACGVLLCMGMIFTMSNSLAMNEGRDDAGRASALLGFFGYAFGASVSPLVGLGNMLHSTAIIYLCLLVLIILFACLSRRIAPDLK